MNGSHETFEEWSARWKQERDAAVQAERLFNNSATDRVITAVGRPPSDRDALADELERLARIHSLWSDANDQPAVSAIGKWLAGFVGAVRTVRDFLAHPPGDDHEFLARLIFIAGQGGHDISQVRHRDRRGADAGGGIWAIATRQIVWARPDRLVERRRPLVNRQGVARSL